MRAHSVFGDASKNGTWRRSGSKDGVATPETPWAGPDIETATQTTMGNPPEKPTPVRGIGRRSKTAAAPANFGVCRLSGLLPAWLARRVRIRSLGQSG